MGIQSLEELGIDYNELATIVRRMFQRTDAQIEIILEKADDYIATGKIPYLTAKKAIACVCDLCYDRDFCRRLNVDYHSIEIKHSRRIRAGLASYLMKQVEDKKV